MVQSLILRMPFLEVRILTLIEGTRKEHFHNCLSGHIPIQITLLVFDDSLHKILILWQVCGWFTLVPTQK